MFAQHSGYRGKLEDFDLLSSLGLLAARGLMIASLLPGEVKNLAIQNLRQSYDGQIAFTLIVATRVCVAPVEVIDMRQINPKAIMLSEDLHAGGAPLTVINCTRRLKPQAAV